MTASVPTRGNSELVVLVDDDAATLDMLSELLEAEADYHVIAVDNPCQAYDVIRRAKPSLVVTDVWLGPEVSGLELAERLGADGGTRDIPILFVSARSEAQRLMQSRRNTDFLAKPFDIDELLVRVARACKAPVRPQ